MEVLCYALASALLVLTGAVVSAVFRCRGACRAKTQRKPRPDDALSRDIAALMAYGREEEEENAV